VSANARTVPIVGSIRVIQALAFWWSTFEIGDLRYMAVSTTWIFKYFQQFHYCKMRLIFVFFKILAIMNDEKWPPARMIFWKSWNRKLAINFAWPTKTEWSKLPAARMHVKGIADFALLLSHLFIPGKKEYIVHVAIYCIAMYDHELTWSWGVKSLVIILHSQLSDGVSGVDCHWWRRVKLRNQTHCSY